MKQKISSLFLTLILLLFSSSSQSKVSVELVHGNIPYEMHLMLKSMPYYTFTEKEYALITSYVELLNESMKKVIKKDIFILAKSEIYKHFLDYQLNPPYKDYIIQYGEINGFQKFWNANYQKYPPLIQWLGFSLIGDLERMNQLDFLEKVLTKRKMINRTLGEKKAIRDIKYISPWIRFLMAKSRDEFITLTKDMMLHLLQKTTNAFTAMELVSPNVNNNPPILKAKITMDTKKDSQKDNESGENPEAPKNLDALKGIRPEKEIDQLMKQIESQKKQWKPKN